MCPTSAGEEVTSSMGRRTARTEIVGRSMGSAEAEFRPIGTLRGRWLTAGKDGRLTLYAIARDGLLRWTEGRPGGPEWTGPDFFRVEDLTDLTIAQGADSYVHFLGRRDRPDTEGPGVDIVHAIQYQTGRPVTEWRSLGNPYRGAERGRLVGVPAGAVDARGTVFVFVRNAGGGLQLRRERPDGGWSAWQDLKGARLANGPVPAATSNGFVEVLVPTERGVLQWRQGEPDGPFGSGQLLQIYAVEGSGATLETAPGRLTYYWVDPNTGGLVAFRAGAWPVPLGGAPGAGAVAAVRAPLDGYDCTVLAHRGTGGTLLMGACSTEGEHQGVWWQDTGVNCAANPALARDAFGRIVVAVLGADGVLRVTRQEVGPGLTLSPQWQAVG